MAVSAGEEMATLIPLVFAISGGEVIANRNPAVATTSSGAVISKRIPALLALIEGVVIRTENPSAFADSGGAVIEKPCSRSAAALLSNSHQSNTKNTSPHRCQHVPFTFMFKASGFVRRDQFGSRSIL